MTRLEHCRRIVNGIPPEILEELRLAPLNALTELGIQVQSVQKMSSSRGAGGLCDGLSFVNQNIILYAATDSRRQNFTLLHEYAHLTVEEDDAALIWLADQYTPMGELELLCNDIAATILISDEILDNVIGKGPIKGANLLELFRQTEASQIACAIALAKRLSCDGAVVLTDRNSNTVVHASLSGEPAIYPGSQQIVPHGHPLRSITPVDEISIKSFWTTPWGKSGYCYINAAASKNRTYSIFADVDLWRIETFHAPIAPRPTIGRPSEFRSCKCGFSGVVIGWPCDVCDHPYCPRCNSCDCDRRANLGESCTRCFLTVPKVDLVAGVCSNCR